MIVLSIRLIGLLNDLCFLSVLLCAKQMVTIIIAVFDSCAANKAAPSVSTKDESDLSTLKASLKGYLFNR